MFNMNAKTVTVWFVGRPYIDGLVDRKCLAKRGRDGKWNFKERAALKAKLLKEWRDNEAKIKEAGLTPARSYTTKAKADAHAALIKQALGIEMDVCEGCWL